jgi:glycosyltransferase involved in cell wall biosynthesis
MSLSRRAQEAFHSGKYQKAVDLYLRAITEQPELEKYYSITLKIAKDKLNSTPLSEDTETTPFFSENLLRNISQLYEQANLTTLSIAYPNTTPLVSILITTHNMSSHIEASVTSALRQGWPNIEVIVVDDFSEDETWTILKRLQRSVSNLKCKKLNAKCGKYFALNCALDLASGDFIFFQNGDELSHPQRAFAIIDQLSKHNINCIQESICTLDESGYELPNNDHFSAFETVTLSMRRSFINEIGYFNCTSTNPGLEFYNRASSLITQKPQEGNFSRAPLCYKFLHNSNDLSDSNPFENKKIENTDKNLIQGQFHKEKHATLYHWPVGSAPNSIYPTPGHRTCKAHRVVASLCSIPERAELLRQVIKSLAPQVDAIHVYLDRYQSIPNFLLSCHDQITVYLSKDHPGLRDNGKFLAFPSLTEECYYFTADDDIIYPPDYVASMVQRIEDYDRQAVIGVHGVLLPEQAKGYFSSFRKVHIFNKALERDALVNNLGTGTVAFHSSLLQGMDLSHFSTPGMADLHLSVFCKQRDIPMVALARPDDWLQELPSPNTSLYHEFRQADDSQSQLIRAHQPWGYAAISQAVAGTSMRASSTQVGERLQLLIPILHACLK